MEKAQRIAEYRRKFEAARGFDSEDDDEHLGPNFFK